MLDTAYVYTYFDDNQKYILEYNKLQKNTPIKIQLTADSKVLARFNDLFRSIGVYKQTICQTSILDDIKSDISFLQSEFNRYIKSNVIDNASITYGQYEKSVLGTNFDLINNKKMETSLNLKVSFDIYCKDLMRKYSISRVVFDSLVMPYIRKIYLDESDVSEDLFKLTCAFEKSKIGKESKQESSFYQLEKSYEVGMTTSDRSFKKISHKFFDDLIA